MQNELDRIKQCPQEICSKQSSPLLRGILLVVGSLSVALGLVGMFLPLLPTTPFLLLAAACYSRSSKRFYRWLVNNRFFGKHIVNYREKGVIALKAKITALLLLWLTILLSVLWVVPWIWLKIVLVVVAIAVSIHILSLKSQ